jgi:hypothetical protein
MSCLRILCTFLSSAALLACSQPVLRHDHAAHTEVGIYGSQATQPSAVYLDREPPLYDNLGTLSYPITTQSQRAQAYFDQGLRLAHAFNHPEARRSFRIARRLDPGCAMCYWGEALVLGPNINAPMDAMALPSALAALRKAKTESRRATDKERALIAALAERYSDDPKSKRPALDKAYAEAMGQVHARFPNNPEIAVLYAESLLNAPNPTPGSSGT